MCYDKRMVVNSPLKNLTKDRTRVKQVLLALHLSIRANMLGQEVASVIFGVSTLKQCHPVLDEVLIWT